MRDYLNIGSAPADEDCAQVGEPNYAARAKAECRRFIEEIRIHLGMEPDGAELAVKSFPHDFGTYYEVVCYFNTDNERSMVYAYDVESMAPVNWTERTAKGDS